MIDHGGVTSIRTDKFFQPKLIALGLTQTKKVCFEVLRSYDVLNRKKVLGLYDTDITAWALRHYIEIELFGDHIIIILPQSIFGI